MKKLLAVLLVLGMLFSMAACSADDAVEILDILLEEAENLDYQETEGEYTEPSENTFGTEEAPTEPEDTQEPAWSEAFEPTVEMETEPAATENASEETYYTEPELLDEHGTYSSKEDVALYIFQYGHLPDNYISKKDAEKLGWTGGSLEPYAPGKCIGGSRFGNYEGLLPTASGRVYTECDIDTLGAKSRGAKRIVFSNDGLIYYTEDHYASFELLYGEEE